MAPSSTADTQILVTLTCLCGFIINLVWLVFGSITFLVGGILSAHFNPQAAVYQMAKWLRNTILFGLPTWILFHFWKPIA